MVAKVFVLQIYGFILFPCYNDTSQTRNKEKEHHAKEAQKNGLKLIVDRIESINPQGYPMVLTGDFNIKPTDMIIDYIYISGFSACPEYKTVTKKYADRPFVSDHYPIFARLVF